MPSSVPRVTVIVPTFSPGEGLARVISSLDAQTLPQDEFDEIDGIPHRQRLNSVVDTGSPGFIPRAQ